MKDEHHCCVCIAQVMVEATHITYREREMIKKFLVDHVMAVAPLNLGKDCLSRRFISQCVERLADYKNLQEADRSISLQNTFQKLLALADAVYLPAETSIRYLQQSLGPRSNAEQRLLVELEILMDKCWSEVLPLCLELLTKFLLPFEPDAPGVSDILPVVTDCLLPESGCFVGTPDLKNSSKYEGPRRIKEEVMRVYHNSKATMFLAQDLTGQLQNDGQISVPHALQEILNHVRPVRRQLKSVLSENLQFV